ncbi:TatD family hydrolase, partial [Candidatus Bathyarchaeota archaeon]|nr:TatD family hydrolase [Candidatus Bathyarchaeota archaeon]
LITTQWRAFMTQLSMAEKLDLPVVVHDREAHADILKALLKFKGKIRGIMHCFSGSKEMARQCIELNFYISFAGSVTYPKSRELREVAKWVDLDRILLETDCPWLAPQDVRGRRNEPAFLPFIAREIAALRKMSVEELAKATTANVNEILKLG